MIKDKREERGRWCFVITGQTATSFRKSVGRGGAKSAITKSIKLLEEVKVIFTDKKYWKDSNVARRIDRLIKRFKEAKPNDYEVDRLLNRLYDFCDQYSIFINF